MQFLHSLIQQIFVQLWYMNILHFGTSLGVWWLRLHLPMQGIWIQPLVGEPTSCMPQPKNPNMKQKQYCNRFNKNFTNGPYKKKILKKILCSVSYRKDRKKKLGIKLTFRVLILVRNIRQCHNKILKWIFQNSVCMCWYCCKFCIHPIKKKWLDWKEWGSDSCAKECGYASLSVLSHDLQAWQMNHQNVEGTLRVISLT